MKQNMKKKNNRIKKQSREQQMIKNLIDFIEVYTPYKVSTIQGRFRNIVGYVIC